MYRYTRQISMEAGVDICLSKTSLALLWRVDLIMTLCNALVSGFNVNVV